MKPGGGPSQKNSNNECKVAGSGKDKQPGSFFQIAGQRQKERSPRLLNTDTRKHQKGDGVNIRVEAKAKNMTNANINRND